MFDPDGAIREAFETWLTQQWPKASAAFAAAMDESTVSNTDSLTVVANFAHDLSGTAPIVGQHGMGRLAKAISVLGRNTEWRLSGPERHSLQRLWTALSRAISNHFTPTIQQPDNLCLAPVADLLEELAAVDE